MNKLILLLLIFTIIPAWTAQWTQVESNQLPLVVKYHPGEERAGRVLIDIANDETDRIAKYLQMNTMTPITIVLFSSKGEFMAANKPDIGLMGVSYGPDTIQVLYSDDYYSNKSIIAHELTHSLLAQKLGNNRDALPIWLNEGIAGYLSDPVAPDALKDISELIGGTGVLTMTQMEDGFEKGAGNINAAYVQARSMTAWMEYNHPGALIKILTDLSTGAAFNDTLQKETDLSVNNWWFWWKSNVPPIEYIFGFLNSPAVFAPLAFLVVIAVIIRKHHKKKTELEKEREEEREELERKRDKEKKEREKEREERAEREKEKEEEERAAEEKSDAVQDDEEKSE